VRDVDDRHSLLLEAADDLEEIVRLLLVERAEVGSSMISSLLSRESAFDIDELLLCDRKVH
jgi:hypothetical protein